MMKVIAKLKLNKKERLESFFEKAISEYEFKKELTVKLKSTSIKGSTMQAQPIITWGSIFSGISTYKINIAEYVRGSETIKTDHLPEDVLVGWFAHELGHIKDYQHYSLFGMVLFGLKYVLSSSYRKKVEHRADQIAIEHGFHEEILATKKFLFTHEGIDINYRNKMKRFYMPLEHVEEWIEQNISIDPVD